MKVFASMPWKAYLPISAHQASVKDTFLPGLLAALILICLMKKEASLEQDLQKDAMGDLENYFPPEEADWNQARP